MTVEDPDGEHLDGRRQVLDGGNHSRTVAEPIDVVVVQSAVDVDADAAGNAVHMRMPRGHAAVDDGDAAAPAGRARHAGCASRTRAPSTVSTRSARRATSARCVITIVVRPLRVASKPDTSRSSVTAS